MSRNASNEYLKNSVMTATPEQLQLMLYDGVVRFCQQAREALSRREFETSCEKLIKAQNIVLEMRNGLRPEVNPSLCRNMAALYDFIYNRLIDANINHRPDAIDEALKILEHQRQTWRMLIEKLRHEAMVDSGASTETPLSGASLSIHG